MKADTLKRLITMILSGEKVGRDMLMYVIRFCLPSQDHLIKKLLLVFWEVVPKVGESFNLVQFFFIFFCIFTRFLGGQF